MYYKKLLLALTILAYCTVGIQARAALRRTPKIYNALITTDDNLTSSRAYPVIQPTIHETGIPHYPFGTYNAFYNGYYNPAVVRLGQPIVPGLVPREQLSYPLANAQFPPQLMHQPPPSVPQPQEPTYETYPAEAQHPTAPTQNINEEVAAPTTTIETTQAVDPETATPPTTQNQQQPVIPPNDYQQQQTQGPKYMPVEENKPEEMPSDKLPIALNEYGLPPSLIPLQQYPLNHESNSHSQLPPYIFNQYPLLPGYYDPLTGFRDQYLPPYEYSASAAHTYAIASTMAALRRQVQAQHVQGSSTHFTQNDLPNTQNDLKKLEKPTLQHESDSKPSFSTAQQIPVDFEGIKNNSKSKNSDVPDVPPPPIPSGAKTKRSIIS